MDVAAARPDLNALLPAVLYFPSAGMNGAAVVTVKVSDTRKLGDMA